MSGTHWLTKNSTETEKKFYDHETCDHQLLFCMFGFIIPFPKLYASSFSHFSSSSASSSFFFLYYNQLYQQLTVSLCYSYCHSFFPFFFGAVVSVVFGR